MNGNILSKDNSKILRALAILSIIFHNWFHSGFSVSKCNENSFSAQQLDVFLSSIQLDNIVVETFSFLGWLGVATFVFLTGYGTALSSPPVNFSESIKYVKRNWMKIFLLLLPLVVIYFFLDVITGNITEDTGKRFIYLTLLTNFIYPFFKCYPHINWYFGLTFQFYLLWGLFGRYLTKERILYLCCILMLLGLYICMLIGQREIISIYTHSFTGWFILFALGIWFAQKPKAVDFLSRTTIMLEISLVTILSLLMIVLNYSVELWLFLPIVAFLFFLFLGKLFLRTNFLSKCLIWIGELSACLFVCYPLSRFAVKSFVVPHVNSLILATIVYVVLDFFLAYFYNLLYKRLLYTFKVKVKKV